MTITSNVVGFGQSSEQPSLSKAGVQAQSSKHNAIVFFGTLVAFGLVIAAIVRRET